MEKLDQLEKELHGQETSPELQERTRHRGLLPRIFRNLPSMWSSEDPVATHTENHKTRQLVARLLIGGFVVLLVLTVSLFILFYFGTRGHEAEVTIYDRGPIEAGETLTIPLVVKNISSSALTEVELGIILPENALVIENGIEGAAPPRLTKKLSDIAPGQETKIEIVTRIFGKEGEEKKIQATLVYRPENLRARFTVTAEKNFPIRSVPLAISWEVPETLRQGQDVEMKVRYASNAFGVFSNMSLRVEYPSGFTFTEADRKPDFDNNIWKLGDLSPGLQGSITIKGKITGQEGETKAFSAGLGVYDPATKEWRLYRDSTTQARIAVTPLSVQAVLDGSSSSAITPGDHLNFVVRYRNNTPFTVKDIQIKTLLVGDILDLGTLSIDNGGVFDSGNRSIVWGPGNLSRLRFVSPNEGGELRFSVQTRSRPIVRSDADKNLVLVVRTFISTPEVPPELEGTDISYEDAIEYKIRSFVSFSNKGLYHSSPLPNNGPIPPKVGQKTTYTVLWEIRNFTNDLANVELRASVPPNIKWENVYTPKDALFSYNSASGEIKLSIPYIKAGTGVLQPALVNAFELSLTPSEVDVGKVITLLNETKFLATDLFTNEAVRKVGGAVTTELRDDPQSDHNEWSVVR